MYTCTCETIVIIIAVKRSSRTMHSEQNLMEEATAIPSQHNERTMPSHEHNRRTMPSEHKQMETTE